MKAVMMVGGKGTRLQPYTYILPKPMVPVGKYPVLEIVVRQLKKNGFEEMILTLNHMGEMIKNYFGDGSKFGVKFVYSEEKQPLGTAGHLGLIQDKLDDTFLVINGDVILAIDFKDFISFHKKNNAAVTAVVKTQRDHSDYGVIKLDKKGRIIDYIEKPMHETLVTTGMYLMEPRVLKYVEQDKFLDMPDLILKLIKAGEVVQSYQFDGTWLHLSRKNDFEKATENWRGVIKELKLEDVLDISEA